MLITGFFYKVHITKNIHANAGGLIVLRDIKFGLVTSTQPLKMYHSPPPAWLTLSGLVVMEGSSLGLIPFTVKESNLATVFGSRIGGKRSV